MKFMEPVLQAEMIKMGHRVQEILVIHRPQLRHVFSINMAHSHIHVIFFILSQQGCQAPSFPTFPFSFCPLLHQAVLTQSASGEDVSSRYLS